MRLFLPCPIHPTYRSLAVPIEDVLGEVAEWEAFGPSFCRFRHETILSRDLIPKVWQKFGVRRPPSRGKGVVAPGCFSRQIMETSRSAGDYRKENTLFRGPCQRQIMGFAKGFPGSMNDNLIATPRANLESCVTEVDIFTRMHVPQYVV